MFAEAIGDFTLPQDLDLRTSQGVPEAADSALPDGGEYRDPYGHSASAAAIVELAGILAPDTAEPGDAGREVPAEAASDFMLLVDKTLTDLERAELDRAREHDEAMAGLQTHITSTLANFNAHLARKREEFNDQIAAAEAAAQARLEAIQKSTADALAEDGDAKIKLDTTKAELAGVEGELSERNDQILAASQELSAIEHHTRQAETSAAAALLRHETELQGAAALHQMMHMALAQYRHALPPHLRDVFFPQDDESQAIRTAAQAFTTGQLGNIAAMFAASGYRLVEITTPEDLPLDVPTVQNSATPQQKRGDVSDLPTQQVKPVKNPNRSAADAAEQTRQVPPVPTPSESTERMPAVGNLDDTVIVLPVTKPE